MITPAYSPTATERVLPRMALDFTTASLDSRVTITRALDTATAVNSAGFIAVVNANLPRFDYNPSTLACKGLLIEESRQNRILRSNDFANAVWDDGAPNNATVAVNLVSPDGGTSGATLTASTGGTGSMRRQALLAPGATTYAFSIFVKKGTATSSRILVRDNLNGTNFIQMTALTWSGSVPVLGGLTGTWSFVDAGNGWYRITGVGTAGAGASVPLGASIFPDNAAGTGTLGVYGAQLEAGSFSTSYIPTTTLAVTRNADVVSMTGTNFSSWYNQSAGAFAVSFDRISAISASFSGGQPRTLRVTNTAVTDFFILSGNSSFGEQLIGRASGVDTVSIQTGVQITANTVATECFGYAVNNFALSVNGASAQTDVSGANPAAMDVLHIGDGATATRNINGHVRKISYWPQRITNAEVQAFSK